LTADPNDAGNYLYYSVFLWKQNNFQKGREICKKALALAIEDAGRAGFLNNIGVMYKDNNLFAEAEHAYTGALDSYRKLAADNPAAYLPDLAMTLNNLAVLEIQTEKYSNACAHLLEALEIREKLAAANPAAYDIDLCRTMLTIVFLSNSAPEVVKSAGLDIDALLNRAGEILNKYPDIPQAQELLKMAEELRK
jgi:tetratricopeptide (TPR) repeat protein